MRGPTRVSDAGTFTAKIWTFRFVLFSIGVEVGNVSSRTRGFRYIKVNRDNPHTLVQKSTKDTIDIGSIQASPQIENSPTSSKKDGCEVGRLVFENTVPVDACGVVVAK